MGYSGGRKPITKEVVDRKMNQPDEIPFILQLLLIPFLIGMLVLFAAVVVWSADGCSSQPQQPQLIGEDPKALRLLE